MPSSFSLLLSLCSSVPHALPFLNPSRQLPGQDYEDRRAGITKYVHYTRRALVQLLVLLEWLSGQKDAMHTVMDGAAFLQSEAQQVRLINKREGEKWLRCQHLAKYADSKPSNFPVSWPFPPRSGSFWTGSSTRIATFSASRWRHGPMTWPLRLTSWPLALRLLAFPGKKILLVAD
jgi:hypothetical protein